MNELTENSFSGRRSFFRLLCIQMQMIRSSASGDLQRNWIFAGILTLFGIGFVFCDYILSYKIFIKFIYNRPIDQSLFLLSLVVYVFTFLVIYLMGQKWFKTGILIILGVGFILLDFYIFHILFLKVLEVEPIGEALAIKLIAMVFLFFMVMLLYSNLLTALSTYYSSDECQLLLTLPISRNIVYFWKYFETAFRSSYMLLLFGTPILVAYGYAADVGWTYYAWIAVILGLMTLVPSGYGISVTVVLLRFLPKKRVHQATIFFGLMMAAVFIIYIRLLKPESFLGAAVDEQAFIKLLGAPEKPSHPFLPSSWAALAISRLADPFTTEKIHWLLCGLAGVALVGFLLHWIVAAFYYFTGWTKTQESHDQTILHKGGIQISKIDRLIELMITIFPPSMRNLARKDLKILFREFSQWSQLFMMIPLIIIFVVNIKLLPIPAHVYKILVSFVNLGFAGFVIAAVGVRFLFPAVSLEGRAFWIVRSSPMSMGKVLWSKFIVFVIPLMFLAIVLTASSNILLEVDAFMMWLTLASIFFLTLALAAMGIGMGAIFPKFKHTNAMEVALGFGGVVYMILSLILTLLVIILEATPVYYHLQKVVGWSTYTDTGYFSWLVLSAGVLLLVSYFFMKWGEHALRNLQE